MIFSNHSICIISHQGNVAFSPFLPKDFCGAQGQEKRIGILPPYCKGSRLGYRHGLQKQLWPLFFYYKKFIKYSQYILLRNYISRSIYLLHFHIFKLSPKKNIYSQSLKCLTSDKLKTTSFTNMEGVRNFPHWPFQCTQ